MVDEVREHARQLAAELLEDVELSRTTVAQQVLKAARLARLIGDDAVAAWLAFESGGVTNSPEGRRHMTATARWEDKTEGKGYWSPVADIEESVKAYKAQLEASRIESLSGDMLIPVTREHRNSQTRTTNLIVRLVAVTNRVQAMVHDFARRTYYELEFGARQQTLFELARGSIDGLLAPTVGDALEKVDSIYRRLDEGDREAISQAMSTCRRLIDSFADAVYPPELGMTREIDGQELEVGPDRTRNRIQAYVADHVASKERRSRLRRSLADVYSRVSSGVHADVSTDEARHLFLATYVLLGEILAAADSSDA